MGCHQLFWIKAEISVLGLHWAKPSAQAGTECQAKEERIPMPTSLLRRGLGGESNLRLSDPRADTLTTRPVRLMVNQIKQCIIRNIPFLSQNAHRPVFSNEEYWQVETLMQVIQVLQPSIYMTYRDLIS